MQVEEFLQSRAFKAIIISIAVFILVILVFKFGVLIGVKKAEFSSSWAKEYHNNFVGQKTTSLASNMVESFTNPNGCFGKILQIHIFSRSLTKLIVEDVDGMEKVIVIDGSTIIKKQSYNINPSDLQVNDTIVTIGNPIGDGTIEAELIRVMSIPFNELEGRSSGCLCKIKKIL